ncbi:MAG: AMP-binding protein, partial [Pseudomonadota bacterium]
MIQSHHLSIHAKKTPANVACVVGATGESISYAELEASTNQLAHLFRSRGLRTGDGIVIWVENCIRFYQLVWAAHRAGLYYTPISWHSTAEEASYIIKDSGARMLIASARFADTAVSAVELTSDNVDSLSLFAPIAGFSSLDELIAEQPGEPISDQTSGRELLYTSGTTGNPKGVRFPLNGKPIEYTPIDDLGLLAEGYGDNAVVMAPGPLYHASPLMSSR